MGGTGDGASAVESKAMGDGFILIAEDAVMTIGASVVCIDV